MMIETDRKIDYEPTLTQERERIARAIHDELAQHLTALSLHAHAISSVSQNDEVLMHTHEINHLIADSRMNIKSLIWDLMNKDTNTVPLLQKVDQLLRYWQTVDDSVSQNIEIRGSLDQLPAITSRICYSLVQEAVTNIYRHAKASRFNLSFNSSMETLQINIEDNGIGFENSEHHYSDGIHGMVSRIGSIKGNFELQTEPGQGTRLSITLPLSKGDDSWKQ
jgi:signal transduction histidine kinase